MNNIEEEEEELVQKNIKTVVSPVRSIKRRKHLSKRTGREYKTVTLYTDVGPFVNYSQKWDSFGLTGIREGDRLRIEYTENVGPDGTTYRHFEKITKAPAEPPKMVQQNLFEEEELLNMPF